MSYTQDRHAQPYTTLHGAMRDSMLHHAQHHTTPYEGTPCHATCCRACPCTMIYTMHMPHSTMPHIQHHAPCTLHTRRLQTRAPHMQHPTHATHRRIRTYTHTHTHDETNTRARTCTHTRTHVYTLVYACIDTEANTHRQTYVYTHAHTYMYTYIRTNTYTHASYTCLHAHVHIPAMPCKQVLTAGSPTPRRTELRLPQQ